ncbi:hypothetical protein [Chlamydia felis Fe/C-56]|uniref:Uncharacterized protein n=1 Tax=Chlamydia felis (strain Fe/C-56) TaxID=264202 RepID=Q255Q6_CHLFF|nr:DUF1548 domain-containing protein [Chlamydia felis]BAE80982.1 hypothetical protein [Chlamydia felis Fe/C-56]
MSVFPNPNTLRLPIVSEPYPLSHCERFTTFIQRADYCFLFSKNFRAIGSCLKSPESCWDYLLLTLICVVSILSSLAIYILLIPFKLLILAILCPCQRKPQEISSLPATPKALLPLTELQKTFVEKTKSEILQKVSEEFEPNMATDILSLAPLPSPFLNSLATTTYSKHSCNYKHLTRLIHKLNSWNSGWQIIIHYLTVELKEDTSHPDAQTFPIMMHHLILALEDPKISQEKKRDALREISSYADKCKPTWAESIFRNINNLYNTRSSGRDQILLWLQMFKEQLLSQQQLISQQDEWHQINGLKEAYGEELGLIVDHLNENLSALTLRQTSKTPVNKLKYFVLKNHFEQTYKSSYSELIQYIYDAFLTSPPEIQANIYSFLLSEVANLINLPETGEHFNIVMDCFYDDNCEFQREGIIYLLYIMDIIVSKNT